MGLSSTPSELGGPSTSAARSDRIGQCAQPGRNSWAHWPWPVVMDGVTAPARGQAIPVESLRSSEEPTSTEGSRLPASAPDRSRCGLRPISTRGSRRPSLPPHTPGTDHLVAPRSLQEELDGLGVVLVAVDQGLARAQMSATGEDFTIPTVSVTVTDIVPLASGDSTGAGLALAALPLIMGGIGGAGMTVIALSMLLGGQAQARHTARTPGSARGRACRRGRGGSLIDAMHDGAGQVMRTCPAPSSSCR